MDKSAKYNITVTVLSEDDRMPLAYQPTATAVRYGKLYKCDQFVFIFTFCLALEAKPLQRDDRKGQPANANRQPLKPQNTIVKPFVAKNQRK